MKGRRIAVIGGGASGLAAAIAAAEFADVTVLERGERVGKKILQTGGGRCNVFNTAFAPKFFNSRSGNTADTLAAISNEEIFGFFEDMGLLLDVRSDGLVYPHTGKAASVLDALRFAAEDRGVEVKCGFEAVRIAQKNGCFEITPMEGEKFYADGCILACGGKAAPKTGSDGGGYALAAMLGHSVTQITPALVPLKCDTGFTAPLKGIRCPVRLTLVGDDGVVCAEDGEAQFTDYGISGICAMQLSRQLDKGHCVEINFAAPYDRARVMEIIRRTAQTGREVKDLLGGIVPGRVGQQIIRRALGKVNMTAKAAALSEKQLEAVCDGCFATKLDITGTLSWDNAQVTEGGVPLSEIEPTTMRSKFNKNLAIVGEMLDADGACGGYNLGWAWATGILAGRSFGQEAQNA